MLLDLNIWDRYTNITVSIKLSSPSGMPFYDIARVIYSSLDLEPLSDNNISIASPIFVNIFISNYQNISLVENLRFSELN